MHHKWWFHPLIVIRYHGLSQNCTNETIRVQSRKWMQSKRAAHSVEKTHEWSKTRISPSKPTLSESRYDIKIILLKANIQCFTNKYYIHLLTLSKTLRFTDGTKPSLHYCPMPRNSAVFFLNKGFPLVSHLIASYVGASDIGQYLVGYFSDYR